MNTVVLYTSSDGYRSFRAVGYHLPTLGVACPLNTDADPTPCVRRWVIDPANAEAAAQDLVRTVQSLREFGCPVHRTPVAVPTGEELDAALAATSLEQRKELADAALAATSMDAPSA